MIGKAIFHRLTNDPAVSELIATRCFPELSPRQRDYPVIVYDVERSEREQSFDGPDPLQPFNVTLLCIARTIGQANALAAAAGSAIEADAADWGDSIEVEGGFVESQELETLTVGDAVDARFHVKTLECLVWARLQDAAS